MTTDIITPKMYYSGFVQQDNLVACFILESALFVLYYLYVRERPTLVWQQTTGVWLMLF